MTLTSLYCPPMEHEQTARVVLKYWDYSQGRWIPYWFSQDIENFNYRENGDRAWNEAKKAQAQAQDRNWIVREWQVIPSYLTDYNANQYARQYYGLNAWDAWGQMTAYIMGGPFIEHWALVTESPPYPQKWTGQSIGPLRWLNAAPW